ncbi:MAG: hypothetical protein ABW164_00715 [Sphingobium sp.]
MAEGVGFFAIVAVIAALLSWGAARRIVARRPTMGKGRQLLLALGAFPVAATVVFAVIVGLTLATSGDRQGDTVGMAIFAMTFFLVYALFVGFVVGLPVAFVTLYRRR